MEKNKIRKLAPYGTSHFILDGADLFFIKKTAQGWRIYSHIRREWVRFYTCNEKDLREL